MHVDKRLGRIFYAASSVQGVAEMLLSRHLKSIKAPSGNLHKKTERPCGSDQGARLTSEMSSSLGLLGDELDARA